MAGYIYLPVPTPEMIGEAKLWREGQADKGETPNGLLYNFEKGFRKGFVRNFCGGVLRNVVATDKLYVLCHGDSAQGGPTIGAYRGAKYNEFGGPSEKWIGGVDKSYTARQLATVIQREQLIKSFVDLRVFACGSGVVPPTAAARSYAEDLKDALRALGYSHIRVTGYKGLVYADYAYRKMGVVGGYTKETSKGVVIGQQVWPSWAQKVTF